jgi:hypothetical protein
MAGTQFGGQAELATARVRDVMPLPEHLSFEEGAAFCVSYGTAVEAMFNTRRSRKEFCWGVLQGFAYAVAKKAQAASSNGHTVGHTIKKNLSHLVEIRPVEMKLGENIPVRDPTLHGTMGKTWRGGRFNQKDRLQLIVDLRGPGEERAGANRRAFSYLV